MQGLGILWQLCPQIGPHDNKEIGVYTMLQVFFPVDDRIRTSNQNLQLKELAVCAHSTVRGHNISCMIGCRD